MIQEIQKFIIANPTLMTGLGLGSAGILTFWLKDFPKIIYHIIKREVTTELIMTSQHVIYHDMLRWIEKEYRDKNFRRLKISNGRWGYNEKTITSIGYGFHWIWYQGYLLHINLQKEAANQTEYDKESINITKIGRSRKLFDKLISEIKTVDMTNDKNRIYKLNSDGWQFMKEQYKRKLETIFIEKDKKNLLLSRLEKFINSEQWYLDNSIPYQLGILFYGSPGTGKTSIIKSIASYLNYPIYYIPAIALSRIEMGMACLPDKCIVVIEDIDCNNLTHSRQSQKSELKAPSISPISLIESAKDEYQSMSLSEVLNSLDGMFSVHGRILIATTNHVESLDDALVRPGRIDIKIEIGYVNNEILAAFCNNFFPENTENFDDISIIPGLTVATLQDLVLRNISLKEILNKVTKEV